MGHGVHKPKTNTKTQNAEDDDVLLLLSLLHFYKRIEKKYYHFSILLGYGWGEGGGGV